MRYCSLVAILVLFAVGCKTENSGQVEPEGVAAVIDLAVENESNPVVETATLEIQFNSHGEDLKLEVLCGEGATVFLVMERARENGDLEFESTGRDATLFVQSIGGVKNQAGGGDNWVYRVNGELGDRSCGVFSVNPGDRVLWVFGDYP